MSETARLIAARLIREGTLPREEVGDLDHPDIRRDVERRLSDVGLCLATSAYSEHVGVRLAAEITSDSAFDSASNLGLRSDGCALLVILWARLVLQKRTAEDTREVPGEAGLFTGDAADAARRYAPAVRFEALAREFGDVFGSRTHLKRLVGQLRRLGFAAGRGEYIEAGPLLELGIDGEAMVAFIRRGVLARLADAPPDGEDLPPSPERQVIEALAGEGGEAAIGPIEEATGISRTRLRRLLKRLIEDGLVRRRGERAATRYLLLPHSSPDRAEEE